jgi:branched-subunit amino acid transport protein
MIDRTEFWIVVGALAVGSYALKFTFIGIVGGRAMPEWLMRHLRYTAVAVLPALIAPLTIWPTATGGAPDIPRYTAALVCFVAGYLSKNVLVAMLCGGAALYALLYLGV